MLPDKVAAPLKGDFAFPRIVFVFSHMIIRHGRRAAAPEDEKACLGRNYSGGENSFAHRQKDRRDIGGLTADDNLTRRLLTYTLLVPLLSP